MYKLELQKSWARTNEQESIVRRRYHLFQLNSRTKSMICSEKLSPVITSTAKRPKNPNIAILPSPISTGARSTSASRLSGSSVQFGRGEEESWSLSTWVADSRFNECEGLFTRLANCDDGGWWIEKELTVTAKTAPTMEKCSQFLMVTDCGSVLDEGFGSASYCFSEWVLSNNACLNSLTWTWVVTMSQWWMDVRRRWKRKVLFLSCVAAKRSSCVSDRAEKNEEELLFIVRGLFDLTFSVSILHLCSFFPPFPPHVVMIFHKHHSFAERLSTHHLLVRVP